MKTNNLFRLAMMVTCLGVAVACNKSNVNSGPGNTASTDLQTHADDQTQVSTESDAIADDANTALYSQVSLAGNNSIASNVSGNSMVNDNGVQNTLGGLICDASVQVNDSSNPRTITITYNGTNCRGNRTRTGVVVISIPAGVYWGNAGAMVTINIENLKITRLRDNKSIVLNGTRVVTNVSGGHLVNLASLGTITHTITGNMSITFDNGTQRVWNISKQRVFTYNNGIVITTTGTHTDSLNNSNVAEWGTNRFGVSFESLITMPKIIRQDCDFRLVSGQNEVLRSDSVTSMITYGLDVNGNPTSCPRSGTYYFKLVWTNASGKTYTVILPY